MTWRIKVSYVHDQAPRALTTQLVKHITRRSGTRIFSLGLVLSAAAVAAKLCTPDATSGWRVVAALQASRIGAGQRERARSRERRDDCNQMLYYIRSSTRVTLIRQRPRVRVRETNRETDARQLDRKRERRAPPRQADT